MQTLEVCTVSDVLSIIGRYISASRAATADRRYCKTHEIRSKLSVNRGKKKLISESLRRLVQQRKIKRIRPGLYSKLD